MFLWHPIYRRSDGCRRNSRSSGQYGGGRNWCKFNLIPFNPFPASGLRRSAPEQVQAFARIVSESGIVTTVRKTRGDDIDAACGQLAGDVQDRTNINTRMARKRTVMIQSLAVKNNEVKES